MAEGENVLGRRVSAALIDLVPLGAVAVLLGDTSSGDGSFDVRLNGGPLLLWIAILIAYHGAAELALGGSPGKLALGLRVATVDGGTPTAGGVIVRNVLRVVDGLPLLYLVGFVTAAVTERNQRLGDLAAKTVVVRAG